MSRAIDADELLKVFAYRPADTEDEQIFNAAARKIIREMPTLTPPNEWVSVEDRLPENNAEVLMWRKKWKIAEAGTYRNACFWVYDAIGDSYKADDITYWMPLPAPPEKE